MATWYAVFRFELHRTLRAYLPSAWMRWSVVSILFLLSTGAIVGALVAPLSHSTAPPAGALTGFVIMNLGLGVSGAISGATTIVNEPEQTRLLRLAPVSPPLAMWARLGPILFLTLVPLSIFYTPFLVAFFRVSPRSGVLVATLGIAVVAWAIQLALWIVASLVVSLGREKGLRAAHGAMLAIVLISIMGFGTALQFSTSALPVILFLVATVALLPGWIARTSRTFLNVLARSAPPRTSPPPRWGKISPWRFVLRTPAAFGLVGTVVLLLVFIAFDAPFRWGISALLLVTLATNPLNHIFAPEYERPDRLAVAPYASRFIWTLLLRVGGPPFFLSTFILLLIGWGAWLWIGSVLALIPLMSLSYMISPPSLANWSKPSFLQRLSPLNSFTETLS